MLALINKWSYLFLSHECKHSADYNGSPEGVGQLLDNLHSDDIHHYIQSYSGGNASSELGVRL